MAHDIALLSLPALAGTLLALGACMGCQSSAPLPYPVAVTQASLAVPAPLTASANDATTSEVRTVFAEWVTARGNGDAATFEGLYDTARFEGIRRVRSGLEKRLSWQEWKADQRPAAARGEALRVVRPIFESWPGGTLDAATASVEFDEESAPDARGRRADDGTRRVLVFGRGGDGKLRIVREELGVRPGSVRPANTLSRDAKVARALERGSEN
jgi:hypothetical protein